MTVWRILIILSVIGNIMLAIVTANLVMASKSAFAEIQLVRQYVDEKTHPVEIQRAFFTWLFEERKGR